MIRWFTLHPLAANILMALIIGAGVFAGFAIKTEVIPQVKVDWLQVTIPFPGMSSYAIEHHIDEFERSIQALRGVDEVTTTLHQGRVQMQVMLNPSAENNTVKSDVRALIDVLDRPKGALAPGVFQVRIEPAVAALAISGPHEYQDLQILAQRLKSMLEQLPEVGSVNYYHPTEQEVSILLNTNALARFGLSAGEVGRVLRQERQTFDLGELQEQGVSYRLITDSTDSLVSQLGNPLIRQFPNGTQVHLDDIAEIVLPSFSEGHRLNGKNAVLLSIKSSSNTGLVALSETLQAFMIEVKPVIPQDIVLDVWQDTSKYYKARVEILIENGLYGFLLLFIILSIALHWRFAFWVSFGVPVAFLGGFTVLWAAGFSLNMVSLFAFILVLGVLVDDAIIVGESIYDAQLKYPDQKKKAAVYGVQRVVKPVVVAALTTMIMFVPLLFLPGDEGRMLRAIPTVVIATLAFSLIESLLILPAHLRTGTGSSPHEMAGVKRKSVKSGFRRKLEPFFQKLKNAIQALIHWNCRSPWTTQAFFIGFIIVLVAVMASGRVHYSFFAKIEGDLAVAQVKMVKGASQASLDHVLDQLEASALHLQAVYNQDPNLPNIKHVLRKHIPRSDGELLAGQVALEMSTEGSRETPAEVVAQSWRESVKDLPGVESFQIQTSLNPERNTSTFYLSSDSREMLEDAAMALGDWLRQQRGVEHVELGGAEVQPQIQFHVNAYGKSLGLNSENIAQQIRVLVAEEILYDLQTETGAMPVRMRVSSADGIQSISELGRLPVLAPQGLQLSLADVAQLERTQRPLTLSRHNAEASVQVTLYRTSDEQGQYWTTTVWRQKLAELVKQHFPSVRYANGLYQQEQKDIEKYLMASFALALFCMYCLMAVILKSYWMPLIIIYAVPFGLVGAIIGHWVMGISFTLYSLIGAFAVSGIVVNDNLVLLDRFLQRKSEENDGAVAIVNTVTDRMRAVILTTLTTVLGMIPLIMESSIQSQFLKPMAVSLAFGIATATVVTLFLVPATLALFYKRMR